MSSIIIYFVAFLEWFTTLSIEIVALRSFTPIVGSNSITTSIVLWVILIALSYGYYIWWKKSNRKKDLGKILFINFVFSSLYYFFISFSIYEVLLNFLLSFTSNYFFSILISSISLFFIPIFLASQTIPILAEILKWKNSWEKMWKLLFYSTIWSFVGAVGTSTFFFPIIWVAKTGILSSIILILLALITSILLLKNKKRMYISFIILFIFIFYIFFNININKNILFKTSNAYHDIMIYDIQDKRIFSINNGYSSWINRNTKNSFFKYIQEWVSKIKELEPKNILIIWAGWFTLPNDIEGFDFIENIDVVDVDKSLKKLSEKYFFNKTLSKKITFYAQPARYFINNVKNKKYDFIFIDAYSGKSIPSQFLTLEFFKKIDKIWDNIYFNMILDTDLTSDFSNNILSTINTVFKESSYIDVNKSWWKLTNFIVSSNYNKGYIKNNRNNKYIYTDDKNFIEIDIFKLK